MREADWSKSNDLEQMAALLKRRLSPRKWRLFVCACCRQVWAMLDDECARRGVEVAEAYADGGATVAMCHAVAEKVRAAMNANVPRWTVYRAVCDALADEVGRTKAEEAARNVGLAAHQATGVMAVRQAQPSVFRDIAGNPFRPSPPLSPGVLAWNDRLIPRLAQAAYDDRLPDGTLVPYRLAIIGDALLDAGCDDEELLSHLRSAGPHWRGCWGVDLLLIKS